MNLRYQQHFLKFITHSSKLTLKLQEPRGTLENASGKTSVCANASSFTPHHIRLLISRSIFHPLKRPRDSDERPRSTPTRFGSDAFHVSERPEHLTDSQSEIVFAESSFTRNMRRIRSERFCGPVLFLQRCSSANSHPDKTQTHWN
ncbi:hypothetical protein QQF64_005260 [Cirrhinus molitorella]|uniref:Uncharacterized protein n=1 Tax=Cirrhinus molitorella TaxID=172907 RepID=A0ABR3MIK9_9TELE